MFSSQNNQDPLLPNTLEKWAPLFEKIGIPKILLEDSVTHLENVQYSKLYDSCNSLKNLWGFNTFHMWHLLLLSNDSKAIEATMSNLDVSQNIHDLCPFHFILISGNTKKAKLMIAESKSLLEIKTKAGINALHIAAISGNPDCIEMVLADAPNNLLVTRDRILGRNALQFAILSGKPAAILDMIKRDRTLLEAQNNLGNNALHCAAETGNLETIKLIIDAASQLQPTTNDDRSTVLHKAAESLSTTLDDAAYSGSPEAISAILKAAPNLLETKNSSGVTPLFFAVCSGNPAAVTAPASKPELLEATDNNNQNVLHYASLCNNSGVMLEHLLRQYPKQSAKCWNNKNNNGDTPDDLIIYFSDKTIAPTPILKSILKSALVSVLAKDKETFASSIYLIECYKEQLLDFILKDNMLPDDQLQQLLADESFKQAFGKEAINQILPTLSLRQKKLELVNQPLTKKHIESIVAIAEPGLELKTSPGLFQNPRTLIADLKIWLGKLSESNEESLPDEAIIVLTVMIHDYQLRSINPATREIENAAVAAIEATKTLQLTKPKARLPEGRDISPTNFAKHLEACRETLKNMPGISDDTRRITNKVFEGIEHILTNRDKIIEHVRTNYGVLYEVAKELPLHTDHVAKDKPEEYYTTLERLVQSFFGAFYLTEEAGQLKTFCDKVSTGYCFEGKVRDPFEWAIGFSEIQPFDKLMGQYIKEYLAYQKMIHGINEDDASQVELATTFICARHEELFCKPDSKYAQDGIITPKGVSDYLEQVMLYDNKNQASPSNR